MGFWIFMLCSNLMIPALMIIFGRLFMKKPPKDINSIYGYRTNRSRAGQKQWDFAHAYFGKLWFFGGLVLAAATIIAMCLLIGKETDIVGEFGGIITGVECFIMIIPIVPTEIALKKRFGK